MKLQIHPNRAILATSSLALICFAAFVAGGCNPDSSVAKDQHPVNLADPTGTGMSPQEQLDKIENNPNLPPGAKDRMTRMLKKRIADLAAHKTSSGSGG